MNVVNRGVKRVITTSQFHRQLDIFASCFDIFFFKSTTSHVSMYGCMVVLVVLWAAGQQAERSILHQGHDS